MPLNQITVGPPSSTSFADGSTPGQLGGKQGEAIVSTLHGKYYAQTVRGNVFYASNAGAGAVFSIYSNASFTGLLLWNPMGSGRNLSLIRANVGITGQASTAASGWGYVWLVNAGANIGTAYPLSGFTAITATRGTGICGLGGQGMSVARAGSAATLTTAFTWGRAATFGTSTGAITTEFGEYLTEDFDGTMIVPPNTVWALTSNILSGITAVGTVFWEEVPL